MFFGPKALKTQRIPNLNSGYSFALVIQTVISKRQRLPFWVEYEAQTFMETSTDGEKPNP